MQVKKPTRRQKILIQKKRLNPDDWMIERETPEMLMLVHRHFDKTKRIIYKGEKTNE